MMLICDSFSQVTSEMNPDTDFRFGYTGRERDKATGLMYYRARYYDRRWNGSSRKTRWALTQAMPTFIAVSSIVPPTTPTPAGKPPVVGGVKAIKAVGAVLALGAGGVLLNNQLQSEETREPYELQKSGLSQAT
ncbi:hypothetical protein [Adonisia turfae]|uniref:hypothetical protein n=1 Tax=Adonisia turfae TaxID=2950184 RepID=UPI0032B578A9